MYHSFDAELAQALGVAEAILLHHMQYWIAKNEADACFPISPSANWPTR